MLLYSPWQPGNTASRTEARGKGLSVWRCGIPAR